jgi:CRP-like cAMP-binding protein
MLHHQKFLHLQHNEFFGLFPAHVRTALEKKCETKIFKVGKTIFKRGEEGLWMAAIIAGRVRIQIESPDNKKMLLSMFERGEIFGERALLDGLARGADAIAEEETMILIIKKDDIMPLLYQYPDSMFAIVKLLCNRLLRYANTMELFAFEDLSTRLASYLLFLAGTHGKELDGQMVINTTLTQTDFAQRLGGTRESINRQMKNFEKDGLIAVDGHSITLLNREKLAAMCEARKQ